VDGKVTALPPHAFLGTWYRTSAQMAGAAEVKAWRQALDACVSKSGSLNVTCFNTLQVSLQAPRNLLDESSLQATPHPLTPTHKA
jgi:hypothetical protein